MSTDIGKTLAELREQGSVIVRGAIPAELATSLRASIDGAFATAGPETLINGISGSELRDPVDAVLGHLSTGPFFPLAKAFLKVSERIVIPVNHLLYRVTVKVH